jgi:polyisoprenoid-binding protein YceI
VDITADATLRINGVQRRVKLHVKGRRLSDDGFQFISDTRIRMTDYGVEPPTALFGLIKVDDEVTIHLDIVTRAIMKEG